LNEAPYNYRSLINERPLRHFHLGPEMEPLGDSLENIMFNKLVRNHVLRDRAGETHTLRSSKRAPTSSESKGKRPSSSLSPGPVASSSLKRPRTGSMGAPPSRRSCVPPSAHSSKDEMDTPPRSLRTSSACLHSRQSLGQLRERNPLVANLGTGGLDP
ncbi:UNVERIFIED_CONTAM: hypothetical protein Sindi_2259800, partial [Sesamum indicum]